MYAHSRPAGFTTIRGAGDYAVRFTVRTALWLPGAEVKNEWSFTSTRPVRLHGGHTDSCTCCTSVFSFLWLTALIYSVLLYCSFCLYSISCPHFVLFPN
jgi:hypothetical protein